MPIITLAGNYKFEVSSKIFDNLNFKFKKHLVSESPDVMGYILANKQCKISGTGSIVFNHSTTEEEKDEIQELYDHHLFIHRL